MKEPGQTAYEVRFPEPDRVKRYACEWADLDPAGRAVWKRVEEACVTAALRRVHELETRLEMNSAYDSAGNRIAVEPGTLPDGIECRDDAIKLLDERIVRLTARAEKAEADLRIANRGGLDILYAIRAAIGWTDKHSLALLPHECARLKNLASQWPDEASPVREQIIGAIRAFTSATTSEADTASRAILRIVRNAAPRGVQWPPKGFDRDGGFDGPTGAD